MEDFNCLSYWFAHLEQVEGLLLPETRIVHAADPGGLLGVVDGGGLQPAEELAKAIGAQAADIGYPCFLRTGHLSAKHDWRQTCWVESPEHLVPHIVRLVEASQCASIMGLPVDVWVVRKPIETKPIGRSKNGMPMGIERRYFIADGQVVCHHPYWPPEAVVQYAAELEGCKPQDVRQLRMSLVMDEDQDLRQMAANSPLRAAMERLTNESQAEVEELTGFSQRVAEWFDGAWSVDWLQDADGCWWAIDMALAENSWHYPGCAAAAGFAPVPPRP